MIVLFNAAYTFGTPALLDLEALDIEILASPIEYANYKTVVPSSDGRIDVRLDHDLAQSDKDILAAIIANHDGKEAIVSTRLQGLREKILSKMAAIAHKSPLLNSSDVSAYLTDIDNYFNCWKRDGNASNLTNKIGADAQPGEPHEVFLNTDVNGEGLLAYQFLVGNMPTDPYLA